MVMAVQVNENKHSLHSFNHFWNSNATVARRTERKQTQKAQKGFPFCFFCSSIALKEREQDNGFPRQMHLASPLSSLQVSLAFVSCPSAPDQKLLAKWDKSTRAMSWAKHLLGKVQRLSSKIQIPMRNVSIISIPDFILAKSKKRDINQSPSVQLPTLPQTQWNLRCSSGTAEPLSRMGSAQIPPCQQQGNGGNEKSVNTLETSKRVCLLTCFQSIYLYTTF